MSSSNVTPVPPAVAAEIGKLHAFVHIVSGYVKTHEKFLAVILAAALAWGISGKVQDIIAKHDQNQYAEKQAELTAQVQANALMAASNAKLAEDYKAVAAQTAADNRRLQAETAALLTALAKQQATDRTLPAPDLARRIETLAAIPTGSVQPSANDSFTATHDAAVGIAVTLEKVPALEGQLANAQQEKANVEKEKVAAVAQVTGLNAEIGGLKSQIVKADGVCDARVKVVKDAAAKSKRRWLVAGYVAGLATRGIIKIFGGF